MKYFHPSGFCTVVVSVNRDLFHLDRFTPTDLHRLYFAGDVTAWFSRVLHALSPIHISRTKRDRVQGPVDCRRTRVS